jgi:hypothetical protein
MTNRDSGRVRSIWVHQERGTAGVHLIFLHLGDLVCHCYHKKENTRVVKEQVRK